MISKLFSRKFLSLILCIGLIFSSMCGLYVNAETDLEALKAAYDAAREEYNEAKSAFEAAESLAVFKEDFEGDTRKVGILEGSKLTETIVTDESGNKYAQLVSAGGGTYYGMKENCAVAASTKYKVVIDYKISNAGNNSIRWHRTAAAGGSATVGIDYLNNTTGWSSHVLTSPAYTATETYFRIGFFNASAGAEVCIDNFMIFSEANYNTYVTAKATLEEKQATLATAKEAYEAELSPEALAYIRAEEALLNAENKLNNVKDKTCVFVEDYEGETNKMGHRSNGNDTFTEEIVVDGDNKYAKVTVNEGAAASSWYGVDMNNGATDHSKFAVEASTDYYIAFKYKTNSTSNVKLYRAITDLAKTTGANTNFAFTMSDEWTQGLQSIKTADSHSEYFFYFQLVRNTGIEFCIDDVMVVKVADYEELTAAMSEYENAVAEYKAAKDAYDASIYEDEDKKAARIEFELKQTLYKAAKTAYDNAMAKHVFYEDYSDAANVKTGLVNIAATSGARFFTADYNDGYANVLSTGLAWYGVHLEEKSFTAFRVEKETDYVMTFKYRAIDNENVGRYMKIFTTTASGQNSSTYLKPTSFKYNGQDGTVKDNYCVLNDGGLSDEWVDIKIEFKTDSNGYVFFYLHKPADTSGATATTHLDDISVISKADYDALTVAKENLASTKCEYAASFEAYKPYVADNLDKYAEAVEIANAHYLDNICDEAVVVEATCKTPGVYYKNCTLCGRISTQTFEVATDDTNHINTEYIYNSKTERVLHCNDCDTDIKTEQVMGFADINCDNEYDIRDLVVLSKALDSNESLGENADLNGDSNVDEDDFVIERNILLGCYKNVTLDTTSESNAPINENTFKVNDMWAALSIIADGGIVNNGGAYKIEDENLELKTYGKNVTITGGTLDFTDKEIVNFRGNIELKDIAVNWNVNAADSKVFANGYKVTIGENVTTNGMINRIYGGAASGTVDSTNLTLLSGSYNMIFGANENGVVSGTANLYVGGNVNAELSDTDIKNHNLGKYYVYGGGRYNTSSVNNIKLTISDNAKTSKVYASGIAGAVAGKTELFFGGNAKAMSLFGGFYNPGSVAHIEVTMTGGWTEQIFGGNEKCSMSDANSSTKVTATGGTVVRRIYGGCYNDYGLTGYDSAYTVNGTTEVYLGGNLVMTSHSDGDNSIGAGSRYNNTQTETSTLYITQDLYDNYKNKIGGFGYGYDELVVQ